MDSKSCIQKSSKRIVPTNVRSGILQDPFFESARQTLERALEDFKRMSNYLGFQTMAGPDTMARNSLGTQLCWPAYTSVRSLQSSQTMQRNINHVNFNPTNFEIIVDMQGFRSEDITVKVQDNILEVSGRYDCRGPNASEQREIHRRYFLPQTVQAESLQSNLSSDGILVLSAPWRTNYSSITQC